MFGILLSCCSLTQLNRRRPELSWSILFSIDAGAANKCDRSSWKRWSKGSLLALLCWPTPDIWCTAFPPIVVALAPSEIIDAARFGICPFDEILLLRCCINWWSFSWLASSGFPISSLWLLSVFPRNDAVLVLPLLAHGAFTIGRRRLAKNIEMSPKFGADADIKLRLELSRDMNCSCCCCCCCCWCAFNCVPTFA